MRKGQNVKFNILNLAKNDSLYNYGMKVLSYSNQLKQKEKVGWHRVGENLSYYQNGFKRDCTGLVRYARNFFSFTFQHTF